MNGLKVAKEILAVNPQDNICFYISPRHIARLYKSAKPNSRNTEQAV